MRSSGKGPRGRRAYCTLNDYERQGGKERSRRALRKLRAGSSTGSGQALRQAQGRLFDGFGANGGGANPGVLTRVGRDTPRGGRAEVDRCLLFSADVSSFRANVSTIGPDVSTFRANVSSLRPNVFSRG